MSADLSRDTGARPRPTDPHAAYAERLGKRERKSQRCMQRDRMIGTARLLLFLAGCGYCLVFPAARNSVVGLAAAFWYRLCRTRAVP